MKVTGAILGFLFLAVAIYGGTYYAMVQRVEIHHRSQSPAPRPVCVAVYRVGGHGTNFAFSPAHVLDRRLRPEYWGDKWKGFFVEFRGLNSTV